MFLGLASKFAQCGQLRGASFLSRKKIIKKTNEFWRKLKWIAVSNLKYDLYAVYGGRIPFGVRTDSGALFVKEPLDYEKVENSV